jgi:hypothetical protein
MNNPFELHALECRLLELQKIRDNISSQQHQNKKKRLNGLHSGILLETGAYAQNKSSETTEAMR